MSKEHKFLKKDNNKTFYLKETEIRIIRQDKIKKGLKKKYGLFRSTDWNRLFSFGNLTINMERTKDFDPIAKKVRMNLPKHLKEPFCDCSNDFYKEYNKLYKKYSKGIQTTEILQTWVSECDF